ncbi:site-specific integrase [Gemmata sp. JC673]|uniref:Site-specific integrase n=1 Tax=Gemmata algarum TaxID=2975278 RepID=A0ABU5F309_9BACT|nr:site-specific integrase [Gemmata algarum]MDY3561966.1 site-specific integrase [Gemmata algarum]
MASIADDPNGRRRILFVAPDEKRKTIRLGKIDRRTAENICRHVEALLAARISGQPLARDTATWLADLSPKLKDKLVSVGLCESEQKLAVGQFLDDWLAARRASGHAASSLLAWGQSVREMKGMFKDRAITSLTHADGEAYRSAMQARELRSTTVHKRLGHARQMLEDAVRIGHISTNPWKHVRHRQGDPSERRAYVPVADMYRVIERCPNVWWKLLVALARFGGLRIPSEAFSLTWGDVDWERSRLTVPSPKTSNQGKPHRVIPLFPLLRPYLEAAFEHAEEGSEYVVPKEYRERAEGEREWNGANLRTTFGKIVRRAGVDPWPRIWHSLRASCESDLAQSFPLATVTKWLGNTPSVALRHYVDPTEAAFDKAATWTPESGAKSGAQVAQNPAQQGRAGNRNKSQTGTASAEESSTSAASCDSLQLAASICTNDQRERMGIEPT